MESPMTFHPFLLFFFLVIHLFASSFVLSISSSSSGHHLCPYHQKLSLLQFKQIFAISPDASYRCDELGQPSYPKTMSWNESTDCCRWDGITCDGLSGNLIGLDLSCSQLQGTINSSNISLFRLPHIKSINLAFNDFMLSHIPPQLLFFPNLTILNLSDSGIAGQIPSEISHISNLVSLDLCNMEIEIANQIFKALLQNLTQLRELSLSGASISSVLPMNLSSSLTALRLDGTGLKGKVPHNIFNLPNLQILDLSSNSNLMGDLPEANYGTNTSLRVLDLYGTSIAGKLPDSIGSLESLSFLQLGSSKFSGRLPESLGNLGKLTVLDLFYNNFSGQIPESLGNLRKLTTLILSDNNFSGQIPESLKNLMKLEKLDLAYNNFNGQIPESLENLRKLTGLELSENNFSGQIPESLGNLTKLRALYLSYNNFNGQIPESLGNLRKLTSLWLPGNNFSGEIPESLGNLRKLEKLDLADNNFNGQIPDVFANLTSLTELNLKRNNLRGLIPQSISKLVNLSVLILSSNNLSGDLGLFSNLTKVESLDLSHNSQTVNSINTTFPKLVDLSLSSCKIKVFPDVLRAMPTLSSLDLSDNEIHGQIPNWMYSMWEDSLSYLNLSHNSLTAIPLHFPWRSLVYLDLRSNFLEGQLTQSLCNLSQLVLLDMSNNELRGLIPKCLGNFSQSLEIFNLQKNNFYGPISITFAKTSSITNLELNNNHLEGPIPRSLRNCHFLEILNLGNNKINDTFPWWLGSLPFLKVLVLQNNKFHGSITLSKNEVLFTELQIIDLSHNEFNGPLPPRYFENFKGMMNVSKNSKRIEYMEHSGHHSKNYSNYYYQDSVTLVVKRQEINLERIQTIFTTIDLSSNKFEGKIPESMENLKALHLLNLSHNNFTGSIPSFPSDLVMLESVDLSSNQLTGEIPEGMTSLTFLEIFNVSKNHLVGHIPKGKQFDTFANDSYSDNLALCGLPLSKSCEEDKAPESPQQFIFQEEDDSFFTSGFTWKSVLLGYGCGLVFGLIVGCLMLFIGKPKWFVEIADVAHYWIVKRQKQRTVRAVRRTK